MNKSCYYRPEQRDNTDNLVDSLLKKVSHALDSGGIDQETIDLVLQLIFINREMTFVKCWWQKKEMNCANLVLNTLITTTYSFSPSYTVNLASGLANIFQDKDVFGKQNLCILYVNFITNTV